MKIQNYTTLHDLNTIRRNFLIEQHFELVQWKSHFSLIFYSQIHEQTTKNYSKIIMVY